MALYPWLEFDRDRTVAAIVAAMREAVFSTLSRKGCVVAVSGGIDSSVCAAMATTAMGKEGVFALVLPEKDSSSASRVLGETLCGHLGIASAVTDIAPTLEAIGCYRWRDEFYFVLPYDKMDVVLYGLNHGKPPDEVGEQIGLSADQIRRVYRDIGTKRNTTRPLHLKPILMEPVTEFRG